MEYTVIKVYPQFDSTAQDCGVTAILHMQSQHLVAGNAAMQKTKSYSLLHMAQLVNAQLGSTQKRARLIHWSWRDVQVTLQMYFLNSFYKLIS